MMLDRRDARIDMMIDICVMINRHDDKCMYDDR